MSISTIKKQKEYSIFKKNFGPNQLYITASVTEESDNLQLTVLNIYKQIAELIKQFDMQIVHERIFGSISERDKILKIRNDEFLANGISSKSTLIYIDGKPCWGNGLSGIQIRLINSKKMDSIWEISEDGIACGTGWKENGDTYLMLQNIHGADDGIKNDSYRNLETKNMFERANQIIKSYGGSFDNVVRTWIYLSDILDWYDDFNIARNEKFVQYNLFSNSSNGKVIEDIFMPASTGIKGDNPMGASGAMDVLAIIPDENSKLKIAQIAGEKQKSPYRYKSAFSRAMTIKDEKRRQILLSGTAAIDDKGISLYPDDTRAQILKTLEVVDKLISSEGASFNDISEVTVFLKNPKDLPIYLKVIEENNLTDMPAVVMTADVCRGDLLFELDATLSISSEE